MCVCWCLCLHVFDCYHCWEEITNCWLWFNSHCFTEEHFLFRHDTADVTIFVWINLRSNLFWSYFLNAVLPNCLDFLRYHNQPWQLFKPVSSTRSFFQLEENGKVMLRLTFFICKEFWEVLTRETICIERKCEVWSFYTLYGLSDLMSPSYMIESLRLIDPSLVPILWAAVEDSVSQVL